MGTIRIEIEGNMDLASVYLWLTRHRGQVVELDATRRLSLGAPISGARAVIVAAVLQDDGSVGPRLGGVVRALSHPATSGPVRLVFEGRSPAGLPQGEAESLAAEILERISGLVVDDQPMAEVA